MLYRRYRHGCALIKRNGNDYVVAIGGWNQDINTQDSTIEFYDLTNRPSKWEIVTGISLPAPTSKIGTVALRFDDSDCEAMIISAMSLKMYVCSGNYTWNTYSVSKIPAGSKEWVAIDASLF